MQYSHKFIKEANVIECYVYAIKNSPNSGESLTERLGVQIDEKVYGEPMKVVMNLKSLGEPLYFMPNKVEIYQEDNFIEGTFIAFPNEYDFILLVSFTDFKKIYYDYIDLKK